MFRLDNQVMAILGAQWSAMMNRGPTQVWVMWLLTGLWYLLISAGAVVLAAVIPDLEKMDTVLTLISVGLLIGFLYWQLIPVLLVSSGMSLDMKRLLVYPVAPGRLFFIEVLLRLTTGVEVLILMTGAAMGLLRHPQVPWWGPLFLLPFAVFNMLLSAGVRDLLTRLLARKGLRELVVIGLVTLTALPQVLLIMAPPGTWKKQTITRYIEKIPDFPYPWTITAEFATGSFSFALLFALAAWLVASAWFGYSQFQRGLRWDADEVRARERPERENRHKASVREWLYRLPGRLFPDPLGALIEKEIRFLSRAPRFRLVFFMGFSFGILIWFPLIFGRGRGTGMMAENFLVWVSLYAALLLGDVLFWNNLGFDRHAAQNYYILPVRLSTVLIGKNITGLFLLLLEVGLITAVCSFLPLPIHGGKVAEAFAVTLLLGIYLMAAGNLSSTHQPRPMNPAQSWRHSSSAKVQWLLLLVYPAVSIPIALAYLARFAFETQIAFYVVLSAGFVVAALTYIVALDSSVEVADRRREQILAALSRGEGPMGG
jgi:ABC-2 type transport system permease protein